jgi:2-octaprenyl-6-methoxyphenol hydroxylase
MALALALKLSGIDSEIFEARERTTVRRDARVLALSEGARQILDWLGIWCSLSPTAIRTIHVSHRGGFGRTCLQAAEQQVERPGLGTHRERPDRGARRCPSPGPVSPTGRM